VIVARQVSSSGREQTELTARFGHWVIDGKDCG